MFGFLKRNVVALVLILLVLATSHTQIVQAVDSVLDGNLVFTGPGQGGAKDIRTSNTEGGLRIYNGAVLNPIPTGAAIQFFGNGSNSYPGQAFIDAGAHNNAAIIFRTAPTSGAITERLRIDASGNITATGNFSTTGVVDIPHGIKDFLATDSPAPFIVPQGVSRILVEAWGAGGGGGAGCGPTAAPPSFASGGSGGQGAYVRGIINVTPGSALTVSVGVGGNSGAAVSGSPATAGGETNVTLGSTVLIQATGGLPGGAAIGTSGGIGGIGGVATLPPSGGVGISGDAGQPGSPSCTPGFDTFGSYMGGAYHRIDTGTGGMGESSIQPGRSGGHGYLVLQW